MGGISDNQFRTVQRALNVLLSFNTEKKKMSLTDISSEISLPKSTTSRFLNILEKEGFLIKNKDNTYMLGHSVYYLGILAKENLDLKKAAYPVMQKLQSQYNETVSLFILDNYFRVCYEQIESTQRLRGIPKLGEKFELWSGACGKAILAFLPEETFLMIAQGIKPLTKKTITDIKKLKQQLEEIKLKKVSLSFEETEVGICAVAAPVLTHITM